MLLHIILMAIVLLMLLIEAVNVMRLLLVLCAIGLLGVLVIAKAVVRLMAVEVCVGLSPLFYLAQIYHHQSIIIQQLLMLPNALPVQHIQNTQN